MSCRSLQGFNRLSFGPAHFGALSLLSLACATGAGSKDPAVPAQPVEAPAPRVPLPADIVARSALPLYALVQAGGAASGSQPARLTEPELWDRMSASRVICLGEQHDSPQHHYAQRRAIEELARRSREAKRPLAVGFEMFQTPYQPALTGYVEGTLPEAQFLSDSEYQQRWGFDFALYRPLLEAARELGLPALALNAPREVTRKIGRAGLNALEPQERSSLPELDLKDADHRAYFDAAMAHHPSMEGGPKLDDMYAVQVVWDETMAETAGRWIDGAGPQAQLVVLAGAGHCHRSAIPSRLARRVNAPVLSVSAVLRSKLPELEDGERYDWLLVLED